MTYDPTTPAERTKQMRALPDNHRREVIGLGLNVLGYERMLRRQREVQALHEAQRSGKPA